MREEMTVAERYVGNVIYVEQASTVSMRSSIQVQTLTESSSPSMCSTTVLALLLLEPRKNWALRRQEAAAASACSASSLPADCRIS